MRICSKEETWSRGRIPSDDATLANRDAPHQSVDMLGLCRDSYLQLIGFQRY